LGAWLLRTAGALSGRPPYVGIDEGRQRRQAWPAVRRRRRRSRRDEARILSVSERTLRDWLGRIDKDAKEARNRRIFEMWMACSTQEEIAEACDITKETVSQICQNLADLPKSDKAAADHAIDFDPPIYNVWKQQKQTAFVAATRPDLA
jgi:DNA-binding XRE family transcriptional regulator